MQSPTVIALLLASVSAAGTTLRDTVADSTSYSNNFPEYADWTIRGTPRTSGEMSALTETPAVNPAVTITPKGGYECIRSSHNYVFPQTRDGNGIAAAVTEIAANVALTKTFYTHTPEVEATSLTGTIGNNNSLCFADESDI